MFWADRIAEDIVRGHTRSRLGGPLLIRDEKTVSGRVHVGSMRGVAIHGTLSEVLSERGITNSFRYEFNDTDPMDGFPVYLPEEFKQYMGMPLFRIPSPDGASKNYAEYFANDFKGVIEGTGFTPSCYYLSELYLSGAMDGVIKEALTHASDIRRIYAAVSGSKKPDDWHPLSVICEECGRVGTTKVYAFDGTRVSYRCEKELVTWAKGCGYEGKTSPYGGRATLPFKVEWPAKWKVLGVDIEGAGKDHSTKGGTRDVANHIAREVFTIEPPFDIPYEFFLVGGKKMSSSKGQGSSARDVAALIPPHIFRLALLGKDIKQAFNFEPDGETIPTLYDLYDKIGESYFAGVRDDFTRLFELTHPASTRSNLTPRYFPRFTTVSFIVQMPHLNLEEEIAAMKGSPLTPADREELEERAVYARAWLREHAPEKYRYTLMLDSVPETAKTLSADQKAALANLLSFIEKTERLDGQVLHERLHAMKAELSIEPKDLFGAIYRSFLGKESGPKAGWFLSVLPREFLLRRLKEVSS